MPIDELIRAFEDCTLPIELWTHEAHLSVALWYLHHHERDEATRRIRSGIQRYNSANGKASAYHETITLAWIEILSRLCAERDEEMSLAELQAEILDRFAEKEFLLKFYSCDLLWSEAARSKWCRPNRRPFSSETLGNLQVIEAVAH